MLEQIECMHFCVFINTYIISSMQYTCTCTRHCVYMSHIYTYYHKNVVLQTASNDYSTKVAEGKNSEKILCGLAWQVNELETLCENGRKLNVDISVIIDLLSNPDTDIVGSNVALLIANASKKLTSFVESLSKHQRTAATHIWVIMISPKDRRSKPYALPVQCFSYKSLTAEAARKMINSVITEMRNREMDIAGAYFYIIHVGVIMLSSN